MPGLLAFASQYEFTTWCTTSVRGDAAPGALDHASHIGWPSRGRGPTATAVAFSPASVTNVGSPETRPFGDLHKMME